MCARVYIFLVIRACVRAGKFLALLVYQDTARMRVRASCACMRRARVNKICIETRNSEIR